MGGPVQRDARSETPAGCMIACWRNTSDTFRGAIVWPSKILDTPCLYNVILLISVFRQKPGTGPRSRFRRVATPLNVMPTLPLHITTIKVSGRSPIPPLKVTTLSRMTAGATGCDQCPPSMRRVPVVRPQVPDQTLSSATPPRSSLARI